MNIWLIATIITGMGIAFFGYASRIKDELKRINARFSDHDDLIMLECQRDDLRCQLYERDERIAKLKAAYDKEHDVLLAYLTTGFPEDSHYHHGGRVWLPTKFTTEEDDDNRSTLIVEFRELK